MMALFHVKPGEKVDYSAHSLTNLDLSGLDFKGALLTGADLYGVDFTNANVKAVDLSRARLDRAIITRADDGQVRERRKLGFSGAVTVSLVMSDKGVLLADPEIALQGIPGTDREGTPLEDLARDSVLNTIQSIPKPRRKDEALVAEAVKRAVRAAINQAWGKKPVCSVLITVL